MSCKAERKWRIRYAFIRGMYLEEVGNYHKLIEPSDIESMVDGVLAVAKDYLKAKRKKQLWLSLFADEGMPRLLKEYKAGSPAVRTILLSYAAITKKKLGIRVFLVDGTELWVTAELWKVEHATGC